jgi:ligand-binding sensor domain-containing protein/two-component sensor histidine kinase
MSRCFKLSVLIIVSVLCRCNGFAQDIHFTPVDPPKDKRQPNIAGITQDSSGYLWLTTFNGLYRYDGKQFISYQHDEKNSNSLAANGVGAICVDKDGTIWISPYGVGLDRFDPVTSTFTHYRHHVSDPCSLASDSVASLLVDQEGTLWVGTYRGLDKLDPKTGEFKHFAHNDKDPGSLSSHQVRTLYEDRQGTIWAGTGSPLSFDQPIKGEGGLNRLDKKTGKFTRYMHDPNDPHTLIDNRVCAIFEDSHGNFWVGTAGDGLHTMNRKTGKFERHLYSTAHPDRLSRPPLKNTLRNFADDNITFIIEDNAGRIWIGTLEDGINVYDSKTQKIVWYGNGPNSKEKLSDNSLWYAYKTREGVLWISSILAGQLYKVNPYQYKVPYTHIGKHVNAFMEDSHGTLWLATSMGLIGNATGKTPETFYVDRKKDISKNNFTYIEKDKKNGIWLSGYNGLYLFDPATRIFKHYHHQTGNANSLISDTVSYVKNGTSGKIWLGTDSGLDQLDVRTETFKHFLNNKNDTTSICGNNIQAIQIDKNSNLWVATTNGLNELNEKTGKFKRYFSNSNIRGLLNDSRGNLWVGNDDGLYKYNKKADKFSAVALEGTLHSGIAEDKDGNLWINALNGVVKFNTQDNESSLYGANQGLNPNAELTLGYAKHNGEILFGDTAGYFNVQSSKLLQSIPQSTLVITGFLLNEVPVAPAAGGVLTRPVNSAGQIRLNYNQSTFSFSFSNIDLVSDPGDSRTFYMLENYDNKWRKTSSEESANFYRIPPGQYIFRVKNVNPNGLVSEKHIAVIISPPYWQTWWFKMVCLLVTGMILYAIWYNRMQKSLAIKAVRNKIASNLHDDLGATLSSISIMSVLVHQEIKDPSPLANTLLEKIGSSSRNMIDSINDMVWAINSKNDNFENIIKRMKAFASEILTAKDIMLHFDFDKNLIQSKLNMDKRENFYLIFKEAINNSAKYSQAKNAFIVISNYQNNLKMTIRDDGTGFELHKIVAGNGLTNMRHRAESMKASFNIESMPGVGTTIELGFKNE